MSLIFRVLFCIAILHDLTLTPSHGYSLSSKSFPSTAEIAETAEKMKLLFSALSAALVVGCHFSERKTLNTCNYNTVVVILEPLTAKAQRTRRHRNAFPNGLILCETWRSSRLCGELSSPAVSGY